MCCVNMALASDGGCDDQHNTASSPSIAWRNLRFESSEMFHRRRRKVILDRLNGCFEYYSLNAFMGPSGAGKTTLLNCLNGNRVKGLTPESEIYLNKDQRDGKVVSYFIEQHVERTIVGKMRVGQILRYAYRFKNGNEGDMEGHIRKTIDELLLDELVLNRNFEQCSGGEQKRVAIAQELMSLQKPTLLFVDEPTTGLDSNAAHLVMKCLRQLATNHRMAIITSIHVPSDDILTLFDKLYVLAKGGVCIYSGRPDQLGSYLETQIDNLVIPVDQPPIEVIVKIACNGSSDPRVVTLSNQVLSAEYRLVSNSLSKLEPCPNGAVSCKTCFNIWHLLLQIVRFFRVAYIAQIKDYLFQVALTSSILVYMSTVFNSDMVKPNGCFPLNPQDLGENSTTITCGSQSFIGDGSLIRQNIYFLGNAALLAAFTVMNNGAGVFGTFVRMFQAEYRNQWYSVGVFYWSATIVDLIQLLLYANLYLILEYWITGQHYVDGYRLNWTRIGYASVFNLLLTIYGQSLGQLIGSVLWRRSELSLLVVTLFSILFVTFSGYLVDVEMTHNYLIQLGRELLQFNSVLKGIVYAFYGVDRCDQETEFSLVMVRYHVDSGDILRYAVRVLINTGLVRLFTLVYIYWRFNSFGKRTVKSSECQLPMLSKSEVPVVMVGSGEQLMSIIKRSKSQEEIEFEKFSRGKIIVAWTDLSLYKTSYVFEGIATSAADDENGLAKKAILKNLNGDFRFGTLNALMGTSGAGKTSLLKVLNGRDKMRLSAQSQFYLSKFTRIQTCFITQDVSGHLLPGLTAKQMLVYASRLKNAQLREFGVSLKIDHQQIAINLLEKLDLSDTVDTPVEKCSGGERKRLALALELTALQMPNLICIDEPTSGLDSNSAEKVVACLRKLTQTHCITIVASIHQPNTEVLLMFDQIYVLARGGVCIYSGPPTSILPHLQTVPEIPTLNTKFPIETLVKHSCRSYPDPIVHQLMSASYLQFVQTTVNSGLLSHHTQPVNDGIQQNQRRFSLEDTWILCARYALYVRGYLWKEWLVYIAMYIGYGVCMVNLFDPTIASVSGCIYPGDVMSQNCTKTEESLYVENCLVHCLQFIAFAYGYLLAFFIEQFALSIARDAVYFYNEHRNGWYSTGSFYLAKTLFDFLLLFPVILLYCYICNIFQWSSHDSGLYLHLVLLLSLSSAAITSFGYLIGILSQGHILLTTLIAMALYIFFVVLSNFFVPFTQLHYLYRLLSNLSISGYLLDSILVLQYGFGRCQPDQIQPLLYLFSLDDSAYHQSLLALLLITILYHTISFVFLINFSNQTNPNRLKRIQRANDYCQKLTPEEVIIPGIGSPNKFHIKLYRF